MILLTDVTPINLIKNKKNNLDLWIYIPFFKVLTTGYFTASPQLNSPMRFDYFETQLNFLHHNTAYKA